MQCPNGMQCATMTIESVSINRLPYFLPPAIFYVISVAFGLTVGVVLLVVWLKHRQFSQKLAAWSTVILAICMAGAYAWFSVEQDAYNRDYDTQVTSRQTTLLTNGLFDKVSITSFSGQDGHTYVTYTATRGANEYRGEIQPIGPGTYLLTIRLAPPVI